jgi:hypothetical protein
MTIEGPEAARVEPLPLEVLNQPGIIWGLAKDVHTQFNNVTGQGRLTDPVKLRLELSDEEGPQPIQAAFTLAEPIGQGLDRPLTLRAVDDKGVLGETLFTFHAPYASPASITDRYGTAMSGQDEWQFPRRVLLCMRTKLLEQVVAPLEAFEPAAFLEEVADTSEEPAPEAQSDLPIKAAIEIEPWPPLFGRDEAVNATHDLEAISLSGVIAQAVERFREVNNRNPGWSAELTVIRGAFAQYVPREVWHAYYAVQTRQTNFEQLAIRQVLAQQAAQRANPM